MLVVPVTVTSATATVSPAFEAPLPGPQLLPPPPPQPPKKARSFHKLLAKPPQANEPKPGIENSDPPVPQNAPFCDRLLKLKLLNELKPKNGRKDSNPLPGVMLRSPPIFTCDV